MHPVTAAVIGVGYLGRFHAQKYAKLPGCRLLAVVDADPQRAASVAGELGVVHYTDYRRLLGEVDAVSIAAPTTLHHEIARAFLLSGSHVLVEKPITVSVTEASDLIDVAEQQSRVLQVGHLERFNAALVAMQGRLHQPLFIESHRLAPYNPRGTDVNVVLDLMIHDIDIVLNVLQAEVQNIQAAGTQVLSKDIDIVNARLAFSNGCVANVTASRVALKSERKMRFFQQDACLSVDFQKRVLTVYHKGEREMYPGVPEIVGEEHKFDDNDAILSEIEAFLGSIRNGTPPVVSGHDGRRALRTAIEITDMLNSTTLDH
ncbi:MAG: Gfo/Idh/MocA family oxidoreductase [Gammaproteobacteria bacterium]|nr:Gfo/Idh/MocA family oxidoreductase [Gammaproteobacteria bacterium]